MKKTKTVKWLIFSIIGTWGLFSFLIIAGEDNPMHPLPFAQFVLIKLAAMLSLAVCVLVGKKLDKSGYMPEFQEEE
jgi:hypothetical protein